MFKIPISLLEFEVKAELPVIAPGGAVLTHCREDSHRSVAMAFCILVACSFSSIDAIQLVKQ